METIKERVISSLFGFENYSIVAPLSESGRFSYASGDHVFIPSSLKSLANSSRVTRTFSTLVSFLKEPYPLACDSLEVVVVRRYYDMSHYEHIIACYDIKLPDGTYIDSVPEFLLFSDPVSLEVSVSGCSIVCVNNCIYIASFFEDSCISSSKGPKGSINPSLFEGLVPPIDYNISSDFSLREFVVSERVPSSVLYALLSRPYYDNIVRLVELVLQPARSTIGCPIYISSGFRSPGLNSLVGGARRSYHLLGRAADIYVPSSCSSNNEELFHVLSDLPHVELIRYSSFIHVAI